MEEPKKHTIKSLDDLCDLVNNENVSNLAADTANWLHSYNHTINAIREYDPERTKGLSNTDIARGSFVWVDDGKNDVLAIRFERQDKQE